MTQAQQSVQQMRQFAQQILESITQINSAMTTSSSKGTLGVDAAAVKLQTEQLKTASKERIAQMQLEMERLRTASNERIAQMQKEAADTEAAYKRMLVAQKEAQQAKTTQSQERSEQKQVVDAALSGLETWAAAQRQRHEAMMQQLREEATAFDRIREAALKMPSMDMTQPMVSRTSRQDTAMHLPLLASDEFTKNNLSITQPNDNLTQMVHAQFTQMVGALQEMTVPFKAEVTTLFQPILPIMKQSLQQQMAQVTALIAEARAKVSTQQNIYNSASATAPSNLSRAPVVEEFARAKQPIAEVNEQLAQMRVRMLEATGDPQKLELLQGDMLKLLQSAQRLSTDGFGNLTAVVARFDQKAAQSRTGLQGYFNAVREGLEKLNETSLAANLQEVSFRLLPLGIATGAATAQGVSTAQRIEQARINLVAFTGSEEKANQLMVHLTTNANKLGQPMFDVLDTMTQFAPLLRDANIQLDDAYKLGARLATLNPREGLSGALYAINEAAAGQWTSLRRRFNINTQEIRDQMDDKGFVGALDDYLSKLGKSMDLAEKFGNTNVGAMTRMTDAWSKFLAAAMQPYVDKMTVAANATANFLNSLVDSKSILTTITGTVLTLGNAITGSLLSLGQFALALTSLKALILPGLKIVFSGMAVPAAGAAAAAWEGGTRVGAGAAAGGIGVGGAVATAGVLAAALLLGSVVGQAVAKKLEESGLVKQGESDPSSLWNRLKQSLFIAIAAVSEPIFVFIGVIESGAHAIGLAIDMMVAGIQNGFNNLKEAVGNIIAQMGNIKIGNTTFVNVALQQEGDRIAGEARWDRNSYLRRTDLATGNRTDTPYPGQQKGMNIDLFAQAQNIAEAGKVTYEFVEGYTERIARLNGEMRRGGDAVEIINTAMQRAGDFQKGLFGIMFPENNAGIGNVAGDALGGTTTTVDPNQSDKLEQVYAAAVQNMIAVTRQLEDQTLAASREIEDFTLQRNRALEDYNRQAAQAIDDYQRGRAESIDDFERQVAESEEESRQQRKKQQDDFNKQQKRSAEDHLRDMLRMARDVDDALSGRDFLAAQKALVRMNDAEQDYQTEQKRRREDYEQQLTDLDDNLKKQNDKRREDFERQLKKQDENFALQQQRQAQAFNLQIQREDADRQRRLQRQEQDYAIAASRRSQDFQLQMLQLEAHQGTMQFIWEYGLGVLEDRTREFFKRIGAIDVGTSGQNTTGTGGSTGGNSNGSSTTMPNNPSIGEIWTDWTGESWLWNGHAWQPATVVKQGSSSYSMSAGIGRGDLPFQSSSIAAQQRMNFPVENNQITQQRYVDAAGASVQMPNRGDIYNIHIPIDARGIDDPQALVEMIKRDVVKGMADEIELRKRNQRKIS